MSVSELFDRIESEEFAFQVIVASGFKRFIALAKRSREFLELANAAIKPETQNKVFSRFYNVATEEIDLDYRHPRDHALAVYALAIYEANPIYRDVVVAVASLARNCWWLPRVAAMIVEAKSDYQRHDYVEGYMSVSDAKTAEPDPVRPSSATATTDRSIGGFQPTRALNTHPTNAKADHELAFCA